MAKVGMPDGGNSVALGLMAGVSDKNKVDVGDGGNNVVVGGRLS